MRLTCSQKDLLSALTATNKAVDTNNTLPVLNNVLLKAEGKKLYFTSTNLEVAITYFIETDVKNEGEITIPSKLFTNYISYLKDDKLDILVEGGDIQIKTSDSKTRIKGIPASEFPPIPMVEKEGGMTVQAADLNRAIEQVVFAAALNTTRPILSGVYFVVEKDKLKLASTDSYRLSEKTLSVSNVTGNVNCIVPAKTIIELGSILNGMKEESVSIVTSKNQIMFSVGPVELISRLIEGQFPNYEQIIPKSSKTQVEFDVGVLSLVLKRINIFARENNNKIIVKVADKKVVITTESTQYGEGEITLTTKITGDNNEIALNSQFLLDALGSIGQEQIVLEIGDKVAPVTLKPKDGKDYVHIIMPLKI
ncbi:DNA polymerase III subunit beta [Patescibacteria group bacterium]|nr:DNA polymerase III subunit beta [Patescibacteria group bacterium]MBU1015748.1 DNA polymerase III subunit beta [Patescibacteria group bacterium]MBU1685510.1 DNA polymerase III subunit beta [Patescibacteria group bacterium]MBU1938704.1 DNA polymerase III subunit beta [Patescibacteria group bacterium]